MRDVSCLACSVLTEEHRHPRVERDLLAGCKGIDALALSEFGKAQDLGSISVRPLVAQGWNLYATSPPRAASRPDTHLELRSGFRARPLVESRSPPLRSTVPSRPAGSPTRSGVPELSSQRGLLHQWISGSGTSQYLLPCFGRTPRTGADCRQGLCHGLMVRQGCATWPNVRLWPPEEGRGEAAVADHHQVIDDNEPVPGACCSDGPEGPILGFRGAGTP